MTDTKTDLERFRDWVQTFPDMPENVLVDYTHEIPDNAGVFPQGLVQVKRKEDILGNVVITNRYNFALYVVFAKDGGAEIAKINAEWAMAFQRWVQEQSAAKLCPLFGNVNRDKEVVTAQNGELYALPDEGVAKYYVLVTATFQTKY